MHAFSAWTHVAMFLLSGTKKRMTSARRPGAINPSTPRASRYLFSLSSLLLLIKESIIMASIVLLAMVAGQIKEAEPTVAVLALIGALGLALVFTKASKAAFKTFIRPGKKLKKLGKWAVVTGKRTKSLTLDLWDKCRRRVTHSLPFSSRDRCY